MYSLEGNMPTGQPTSIPSTSPPSTYLFKMQHEEYITGVEGEEPSTYSLSSVAFLYMVGFVIFFLQSIDHDHSSRRTT